jgi:hypothetical protein
MPSVVRTFDYINKKHPIGNVNQDHTGGVFLVLDGKVLGGRPGGGTPWKIDEQTRIHCGDPSWTEVFDDHFHFPIGVALAITVSSGPVGDEYEGHFSGSIELWYQDLGA